MKRIFVVAPLLLASALALGGCKANAVSLTATCAPNAANCSANFSQSSPSPHHHASSVPTPPVASTPVQTPTSTPTTAAPDTTVTETATPTPSVVVIYVGQCDVTQQLQDTTSLETSQSARDALMTCMGVSLPDPQLNNWLIEHAVDAGSNLQDRQQWEEHQLKGAYRQYR